MGCDIHTNVEIKVNGKWLHYSQPRVPRDYDLFSYIANVRNYHGIKPISEPKGLPEDISETTKIIYGYDEPDAHSETWLSSEEFSQLMDNYISKQKYTASFEHEFFGYLFGNGWDVKYKSEWSHPAEDYRVIFWFDN